MGLAKDFCVLDTAVNATCLEGGSAEVYIVEDAARAAHIPGIGTFGSGFLSDPKHIVDKMHSCGVKAISSEQLLR